MARFAVIANPVASQFTGGGHRDVMSILSAQHDVEAIWPSTAAEAGTAAEDAARRKVDVVVAMGGDGMVHQVSQGLIGSDTVLGLIPAGTTNVIARLFGVPGKPIKAAKLIATRPLSRHVGVATMTLMRGKTETTHHAIFACGLGFDAEVVSRADQDPYKKYRFGSIHYARTAIGVGLGKFAARKPHIEMTVGDEPPEEVSTALVQFREVYTYFGKVPLRLAKDGPDPMTVLTMDRLRRTRTPQIGIDVLTGRDLGAVKGIKVWEGVKSIRFTADPPVAAQADGEALGLVDSGVVEWVPDALQVITGEQV